MENLEGGDPPGLEPAGVTYDGLLGHPCLIRYVHVLELQGPGIEIYEGHPH